MSPWLDLNDTDAHDKQVKLSDMMLLKVLWPFVRPHLGLLLLSLIFLPLISLTQVVQPFIVKRAIDGPMTTGQWAQLWLLCAEFGGVLIFHYLFRYVQMVLAQQTGQRIILALRSALYDHLQGLSLRFFHRTPVGKLVTRVSSDVENISEVFASGGIAIFADVAVIVGIVAAMFLMNAKLALVLLFVVPAVIITMEFFRRRSRNAYNEMRVLMAQINTSLQETLTGLEVVQLLQREKINIQQFDRLNRKNLSANLRSIFYDCAFTASVELLTYVTLLLVVGGFAWLHLNEPDHGGITIGVLVAFLQYVQMLFEPIEDISDKFTIIQSGLASVEKISELMLEPSDIVGPAQPLMMAVQTKGSIQFENVTFGYLPDQPVLKHISFTVRPGERIALVGSSGAGKSTIIKLLNRMYDPQSGRILVDGYDIRNWDLAALRQHIVVIPQDEFLFSRSITENITLSYRQDVDKQRLQQIIGQIHAEGVIQSLPDGYDTVLSERGRNLSNGERQLLVFARALWHEPAILVLDEATSAIDPQTEALIQEALHEALQDRTAIIIAHRLSTIQQVDTVYVVEAGEIVEFGSPAELYERQGKYREYYDYHYAQGQTI